MLMGLPGSGKKEGRGSGDRRVCKESHGGRECNRSWRGGSSKEKKVQQSPGTSDCLLPDGILISHNSKLESFKSYPD